jgi:hypothetical protein
MVAGSNYGVPRYEGLPLHPRENVLLCSLCFHKASSFFLARGWLVCAGTTHDVVGRKRGCRGNSAGGDPGGGYAFGGLFGGNKSQSLSESLEHSSSTLQPLLSKDFQKLFLHVLVSQGPTQPTRPPRSSASAFHAIEEVGCKRGNISATFTWLHRRSKAFILDEPKR